MGLDTFIYIHEENLNKIELIMKIIDIRDTTERVTYIYIFFKQQLSLKSINRPKKINSWTELRQRAGYTLFFIIHTSFK